MPTCEVHKEITRIVVDGLCGDSSSFPHIVDLCRIIDYNKNRDLLIESVL
jgi:hypothetical protein